MKFLLVDDDAINREVLCGLLKKMLPCEIIEAEDGHAMLLQLQTERFDAIFADLSMPILDGASAAMIAKENLLVKTPIIAITGFEPSNPHVRSSAEIFDAVIHKPVCRERLKETLKAVTGCTL